MVLFVPLRSYTQNRAFQAGNPFQGISDLDVPEPAWNGLSPVQVMRVKAALDQLLKLKTRDPLLEN